MAAGSILHVNAVGLMAALEEGQDSSLRGRPFVLAQAGLSRSVVVDLSPEAHREGLRRGMPLSLAKNLCRGLFILQPRPKLYGAAEERLWEIGMDFSPLVEKAGKGHLFIDLAGTSRLFGPPEDAAQKIRKAIREATGLSPSLALSSNKTVSKVATRVFRPSGFVSLLPSEESGLLRAQPVDLLPGVGPALLSRFRLLDIEDIGNLADLEECEARAIGSRGPELVARARGYDASPVDPRLPEERNLGGEALFEPDTCDPEVLKIRLQSLAAELGFSLRAQGRGAKRAAVELYYTDGLRSFGAVQEAKAAIRDDELYGIAASALAQARSRRVRIRSLVLRFSCFEEAGPELDLFEPEDSKLDRLQTALDRIHGRFGLAAIAPCASLALKD